jgi:hypothetical protein
MSSTRDSDLGNDLQMTLLGPADSSASSNIVILADDDVEAALFRKLIALNTYKKHVLQELHNGINLSGYEFRAPTAPRFFSCQRCLCGKKRFGFSEVETFRKLVSPDHAEIEQLITNLIQKEKKSYSTKSGGALCFLLLTGIAVLVLEVVRWLPTETNFHEDHEEESLTSAGKALFVLSLLLDVLMVAASLSTVLSRLNTFSNTLASFAASFFTYRNLQSEIEIFIINDVIKNNNLINGAIRDSVAAALKEKEESVGPVTITNSLYQKIISTVSEFFTVNNVKNYLTNFAEFKNYLNNFSQDVSIVEDEDMDEVIAIFRILSRRISIDLVGLTESDIFKRAVMSAIDIGLMSGNAHLSREASTSSRRMIA